MNTHKKRTVRLLLCLTLMLAIASVFAGTCFAEGDVLALNASGVLNRAPSVDPTGKTEGFSAVLYNNPNGLPTSEANAIAETGEGFIWIGSYAGLMRHDGTSFERLDSATGISSVISLYVDSRDRLWIGTNDTGVFVMEQGTFRNWTMSDGLPAVNIRAIAEDADGTMYIATTAGVCMIDSDMNVRALEDDRLAQTYIRDIRLGADGLIYGLTQNGDLFTLHFGRLNSFISADECRVKGIIGIFPDPAKPGYLYLGRENAEVYYGSLEDNFASLDIRDIAPLSYVERFEYINGPTMSQVSPPFPLPSARQCTDGQFRRPCDDGL